MDEDNDDYDDNGGDGNGDYDDNVKIAGMINIIIMMK